MKTIDSMYFQKPYVMSTDTVYCNYIENIVWEKNSLFNSPVDSIKVWQIEVVSDLPSLNSLSVLLNLAEIERANRYYHDKDRHRFITSRAALRILSGKYLKINPLDIEFGIGPNKKPFLKNNTTGEQLHYNTTHSENSILLAFANSEIGVDIEKEHLFFDYQEIINTNFSKEEASFIKNAKKTGNAFYLLWTRKEALAKATAKGLPDDLSLLPSLDGIHAIGNEIGGSSGSWIVSSFKVGSDFTGSIAYPPIIKSITFNTMSLLL